MDHPKTRSALQKQIVFLVGEANRSLPCLPFVCHRTCVAGAFLYSPVFKTITRALPPERWAFSKFADVGMRWLLVSLSFGVGGSQVPSKGGLCSTLDRRVLPPSGPGDLCTGFLMDTDFPRQIHQLHFTITSKQLEHLLRTFGSAPPSNIWSIRLRILPQGDSEL